MKYNLKKVPEEYGAIFFFDGHCVICKKIKSLIEFFDLQKKIKMLDLWELNSYPQYSYLEIAELAKEIHLLTNNEKIYKGFFAFKQVSRTVFLLYPLFILSLIPGMDNLGSYVYKNLSRNRYRFGCETCGKMYCKVHVSGLN